MTLLHRFLQLNVLILLAAQTANAAPVKLQSYAEDTSLPHKLLVATMQRANLDYVYPYANDKSVSNTRVLNDVKSGGLDVMWSMTSRDLEREYQDLYFPIFRGLLGMRLAIVKKENAHLLRHVKSLADLKAFVAGQGKVWPDTQILEHNGLEVAKTLKYPNLFYMLEGGRFDYFPRGINEPWDEIVRHAELNLTVEPHVLIKYRAPLYFFVNKNNGQLHRQLTQALEELVADGSFESLFFADEQVQNALALANVNQRVVIELNNPLLTSHTPIHRSELWFDPLTYQGK